MALSSSISYTTLSLAALVLVGGLAGIFDATTPETRTFSGSAAKGVQQEGIIGNVVWYDTNEDGLYDRKVERGAEGVKVQLLQAETIRQETTTDVQGLYSFEGLTPGIYQVKVVTEHESTPVTTNSTQNNAAHPIDETTVVLLPGYMNALWVDFGLIK